MIQGDLRELIKERGIVMLQKAICFILIVCGALFSGISPSSGEPVPVLPSVHVSYPGNLYINAASGGGQFAPMLAVPGQSMQVTLQFGTDWANLPAVVQSLDGANASYDGSPIAADGTLRFTAAAGTQPGLYRIQVIVGDATVLLQFWVLSTTGDNPPLLIPGGVQ